MTVVRVHVSHRRRYQQDQWRLVIRLLVVRDGGGGLGVPENIVLVDIISGILVHIGDGRCVTIYTFVDS